MNSLDDVGGAVVDKTLFVGDTGTLPVDARRALCKLLAGPFLDDTHSVWPALLREEKALRSRLSDLFLELVIDRERKVAFARQADTGELEAPILMRAQALSFMESVLLVHLRHALVEAEGQDQRAVVSQSDLTEALGVYLEQGVSDTVGAAAKVNSAIEKLRTAGILRILRGSERRFEVSPVLRLLFTAEDVEALGKLYASSARTGAAHQDVEEEGEDE